MLEIQSKSFLVINFTEKCCFESFMQSGLAKKMPPSISGATPSIDDEKSEDGDSLVWPQKITAKEIEHQENESLKANGVKVEKLIKRSSYFEADLKWKNIIGITALHIVALYILINFPYLEKKGIFFYSK